MTLYALLPLLSGALNLSLMFLVFINNRKKRIVRSFLLWSAALCVWNAGLFLMYSASDAEAARRYLHLLVVGTMFIFPTNFHIILDFTGQRSRTNLTLLYGAYALGFLFLFCHFNAHILSTDVQRFFWGYYPVSAPGDILYSAAFAFYATYSQILLYRKIRSSSGQKRNQFRFIFWAIVIGYAGAASSFLPVFGIAVYPLGNLTTMVYFLATAYVLVTVKMVSFEYLTRKIAGWTAQGAALAAVAAVVTLILAPRYPAHTGPFFAVTLLALIAGGFFMRSSRALADRIVYGNKRHLVPSVDAAEERFSRILTVKQLTHYLAAEITRSFPTDHFVIVLPGKDFFLARKEAGVLEAGSAFRADIETQFGLFWEYLKNSDGIVLCDEIDRRIELHHPVFGQDLRLFREMSGRGISVFVMLKIRGDRRGFILLGNKSSGDMYDTGEMGALQGLKTTAENALENIEYVNEITEQRNRIELEIQKTNRLKEIGLLTSAIAHEIRNPLAAIKVAAYNIKRKVKDTVPERHLNTINKKVEECDLIIQNILAYSRVQPVAPEMVDLPAVLREAVTAIRSKYDARSIVFRECLTLGDGCLIEANPVQLKMLFTNILDNACQSLVDGSGMIMLLSEYGADNSIQVTVQDTGTGIPPESLKCIFEPFYTSKSKGVGLGLTVCRQIVEAHRGEIRVESSRGMGTRVTVILPARQPAAASDDVISFDSPDKNTFLQ